MVFFCWFFLGKLGNDLQDPLVPFFASRFDLAMFIDNCTWEVVGPSFQGVFRAVCFLKT